MDTATLVGDRIEDGAQYLRQLAADGFDVTAACWMKTSEEGEEFLYIVSRVVDEKGLGEAFRAAYQSFQRLADSRISLSEIKLIGVANPIAKDIISVRDENLRSTPTRYRGQQLGGVAIDEAIIYPVTVPQGPVVVLGSTSGAASFSQTGQGNVIKEVVIYLGALEGTASWTFPTPFNSTPSILVTNGPQPSIVTSLSRTAVTVTGTSTTGLVFLKGV